jgi:hypothetical protein
MVLKVIFRYGFENANTIRFAKACELRAGDRSYTEKLKKLLKRHNL